MQRHPLVRRLEGLGYCRDTVECAFQTYLSQRDCLAVDVRDNEEGINALLDIIYGGQGEEDNGSGQKQQGEEPSCSEDGEADEDDYSGSGSEDGNSSEQGGSEEDYGSDDDDAEDADWEEPKRGGEKFSAGQDSDDDFVEVVQPAQRRPPQPSSA
ncbi:hypothetical protein Agub_g1706, partial [Astrephomene gubernaculifera]